MTPYSVVDRYQRFGQTYWLNLNCRIQKLCMFVQNCGSCLPSHTASDTRTSKYEQTRHLYFALCWLYKTSSIFSFISLRLYILPRVTAVICFTSSCILYSFSFGVFFFLRKNFISLYSLYYEASRQQIQDLVFDMCYSVRFRNLSNFTANKCTSLTLLLYVTYNLADMFRSVWTFIGASFTWTSSNFLHHTYKSLQSSIFKIFKICLRCVVYLVCCVFHMSWSITLAFRVSVARWLLTVSQSTRIETCRRDCKVTYKSRIRDVHLLAIKLLRLLYYIILFFTH
jgi:hypothetical protein